MFRNFDCSPENRPAIGLGLAPTWVIMMFYILVMQLVASGKLF